MAAIARSKCACWRARQTARGQRNDSDERFLVGERKAPRCRHVRALHERSFTGERNKWLRRLVRRVAVGRARRAVGVTRSLGEQSGWRTFVGVAPRAHGLWHGPVTVTTGALVLGSQ